MKLAIIADIHANIEALKAVIKDAATFGIEDYVCLGDVIGYGANPNEVIKLLQEQKLVGMVLGNHDIAVLRNDFSRFRTEHGHRAIYWSFENLNNKSMDFLRNCSQKYNYDEFKVDIYHGGPEDKYWQYIFPSTPEEKLRMDFNRQKNRLIFLGHSHLAFDFEFENLKIVNPGSIGQPRDGNPDASYVVYDSASKKINFRRVPYDIMKAAEKIKNAGLPLFLAQRLFLGI